MPDIEPKRIRIYTGIKYLQDVYLLHFYNSLALCATSVLSRIFTLLMDPDNTQKY